MGDHHRPVIDQGSRVSAIDEKPRAREAAAATATLPPPDTHTTAARARDVVTDHRSVVPPKPAVSSIPTTSPKTPAATGRVPVLPPSTKPAAKAPPAPPSKPAAPIARAPTPPVKPAPKAPLAAPAAKAPARPAVTPPAKPAPAPIFTPAKATVAAAAKAQLTHEQQKRQRLEARLAKIMEEEKAPRPGRGFFMWRNTHVDGLAQLLGTRTLNRTVHPSRRSDDESSVIRLLVDALNKMGIDNGKRPKFLKS